MSKFFLLSFVWRMWSLCGLMKGTVHVVSCVCAFHWWGACAVGNVDVDWFVAQSYSIPTVLIFLLQQQKSTRRRLRLVRFFVCVRCWRFKLWSENGSFEVRRFVAAAAVVVTHGAAPLQAAGASLWLCARSWPFDSKSLKSFFDAANSDIVTAERVGGARIGACSL